jgi:hypothetical protein
MVFTNKQASMSITLPLQPLFSRSRAAAIAGCTSFLIGGYIQAGTAQSESANNVFARPYTVADSIQLTEIAEPSPTLKAANYSSSVVLWSPDRLNFVYVIRSGDLRRSCENYTLVLISAAAIARTPTGLLPRQTKLAEFCSNSNHPGISHPKWLSNVDVAFLGEADRPAQIYSVNLHSGRLTEVSNHSSRIWAYDLNANGSYVYLAETSVSCPDSKVVWRLIDTERAKTITAGGCEQDFTHLNLFFSTIDHQQSTREVDLGLEMVDESSVGVWISPAGRSAIALRHVDEVPASWADFTVTGVRAADSTSEQLADSSKYLGLSPWSPFQFVVVDAESGSVKPLVDAPAALGVGGLNAYAAWSQNGEYAVLANTFVPMRMPSDRGPMSKIVNPSVVQVDLATGEVTRIADIPLTEGAGTRVAGVLTGFRYEPDQSVYLEFQSGWQTWQRRKDKWSSTRRKHNDQIEVFLHQSLNTPPELAVASPNSSIARDITKLNPQLDALALGTIRPIEWKNSEGHTYHGGLLLPPDYSVDAKYGLVIQTHGFNPHEWIADGPMGSASGFAARALASRGLVVLQVGDTNETGTESGHRQELYRAADVYRTAIQTLVDRGIVDKKRVGIHGWSRTGLYIEQVMVFDSDLFAAVSVADGNEVSTYSTILKYGYPPPGMNDAEDLIGAALWGDNNANLWSDRDPTFHLDRVTAPLLIQRYDNYFGWLDVFALLRRHDRPVELMDFPDGRHLLTRPSQKFAAQNAVVDWFDFWLNGHEDPDSAKVEQYSRWKRLCRTQTTANPERLSSCVNAN